MVPPRPGLTTRVIGRIRSRRSRRRAPPATTSSAEAPGPSTEPPPRSRRSSVDVLTSGMIPPMMTGISSSGVGHGLPPSGGAERHVAGVVHRQTDGVGVLLLRRGHDRLAVGLPQSEVDDLHAGVAQHASDDLEAPIVAVEAQLGEDDPQLVSRSTIRRSPSRCSGPNSSARAVTISLQRWHRP